MLDVMEVPSAELPMFCVIAQGSAESQKRVEVVIFDVLLI